MDKSTFGKKKVPNKFVEGGTVLTDEERLTSAQAYGDRSAPAREALMSDQHPYRKKKNDPKEQHVSNAAWRRKAYSLQYPVRVKDPKPRKKKK